MTPRYGIFCLLAVLIAVVLVFKNYETWTSPLEVPSEQAISKKEGAKPEPLPVGDQKDPKAAPSIAAYIFIAEKNPFHPDRKEFPIVPTGPVAGSVPPPKPPPVRPQVTLYGVTIAEDYRSASLSYPGRPLQKGERETLTVKIGDRVGEYRVAKILEDRVGLEAPEDNFEVFLYDGGVPKKRVYAKTENKPAAVTTTAPGPAEPARPGSPAPGASVQPAIAAGSAPTPVTPATIPNSRLRRSYGPRSPGGQ